MVRALLHLREVLPLPLWEQLWQFFWRCYLGKERFLQDVRTFSRSPSLIGSERATLVERLCCAYPFTSVLEIGCGFGQNFGYFAKWFKEVPMIGIDRDARVVKEGNVVLQERGFSNIELRECDATDLSCFPDNSFDVVYSCAALHYPGPDDIVRIASEMVRVCRGRIICMEQQVVDPTNPEQALGVFIPGPNKETNYWVRDYGELFSQVTDSWRVSITPIENPIWEFEHWQLAAAIIEVNCELSNGNR